MKPGFPLKALFFASLIAVCFGLCLMHPYPDNDLWARLIAGAHIVEKFSVLKADFLSYTPTHAWYDHEWGASAIFYAVLKYFGTNSLVYFKGILFAITMLFCFLAIKERKPQSTHPYNILYYFAICFSVMTALGAIVRCLLFTSMFFAISIYILERARNGKNKTLFLLPVMTVLWQNIHGGVLSLFGILAVYAFGEFLNKRDFKKYFYVFAACIPVLFINPYGFEYVKFLFSAGLMNRPLIWEWLSPFEAAFAGRYIAYKVFLLVSLAVCFVSLKGKKFSEIDKTKYAVILLMMLLSMKSIRYVSFFVFTAGVFLYDDFYRTINDLIKKIPVNIDILLKIKDFCVYALIIFFFLSYLPARNTGIKISTTAFPYYATEFIKLNNLKGNLFINFDWGSFAAYKLYPNNLIVMDGRYEEVYYPELLEEMRNFHLAKGDWKKIITDNKPDVMIIENKYPVYGKLIEEGEWTPVFGNNYWAVFVPTETVKNKYIFPEAEPGYYDERIFETDIKF